MNVNTIYNGDCLKVIKDIPDSFVDIVLTSPPYNTSAKRRIWDKEGNKHYDIDSVDKMSDEKYIKWIIEIFNCIERILNNDGVVLLNLSYSSEKPFLMYALLCEIQNKSQFELADTIIWKKNNALPNNMSKNRLTRICEFVFVFCKKGHIKSFNANKTVSSIDGKGVKKYNSIFNFIEAKNNDGFCSINKATFSSDFVCSLLDMYSSSENDIVFDPFMGTGTTACGCILRSRRYIGIELSEQQCEYANKRIKKLKESIYG